MPPANVASLQDDKLMFDPLSFNDFPAIMASETKEVPRGNAGFLDCPGSWIKLEASKKQQEFGFDLGYC